MCTLMHVLFGTQSHTCFFFFFSFIFISWRLITSQHCSGFGRLIHVFALSESDVDHPAFAFCPWAYISPQDQSDPDAEEKEGSGYRNRRQGSENSSPGLGVEGGAHASLPSPPCLFSLLVSLTTPGSFSCFLRCWRRCAEMKMQALDCNLYLSSSCPHCAPSSGRGPEATEEQPVL